jgi:hypothetical protein
MTRAHETHRRINEEIAQEKAVALGRAGERLEEALAHVAAVGRRLDAAPDGDAEARLLGEYEAARVRAHQARLALLIQREALGLCQHRIVDQQFPEPPRRAPSRRPPRT